MKMSLRDILKQKKVSQKDMAEALGYSTAWASQLVNGKHFISERAILKIAKYLKIHPSNILNSASVDSVYGDAIKKIGYALKQALKQEREECALIVEAGGDAAEIARKIRLRGDKHFGESDDVISETAENIGTPMMSEGNWAGRG